MKLNLGGQRAYRISYLVVFTFILYGCFVYFSQQALFNGITRARLSAVESFIKDKQQEQVNRLRGRADSLATTIGKLIAIQLENIQSYGLQKEGLAASLEPFMDYPEIAGIEVAGNDGRTCAAVWKDSGRLQFRADSSLPASFRNSYSLVVKKKVTTDAGAQGTVTIVVDDRYLSETAARIKEELHHAALLEIEKMRRHFNAALWPQGAVLALAVAFIVFSSRVIGRSYAVIEKQRLELEVLNRDLERRVDERTRELREAQSELFAASRKAGMAEIATNVLHSVGNVLNSVNISADMVGRRISRSKAEGVAKVVQLLKEHSDDLGDFLTQDERGKLLPVYLESLTHAMEAEQVEIVEELGKLTRSVDHIKEIVSTQQSYAGAYSIIESVAITELLEEALRIKGHDLLLHQVKVVQAVEATTPLPLDRARVLQILVNLIANAINALGGTGSDRQITVEGGVAGDQLRIRVKDVGEGIAPENINRIFNHGFTTRKDGHGFGLHSCALAAKEMGGTLTAESEGHGKGATFTLVLPVSGGAPLAATHGSITG